MCEPYLRKIKQAVTSNTSKLFLMHVQQGGPSFPTFTLPSDIRNTLANLPKVMQAATSSRPHGVALQKWSGSLPAKAGVFQESYVCKSTKSHAKDAIQKFPCIHQADSGPLLGEKVFSDSLPASATNIGLGANSFPAEQSNNLDSLVLSNITMWLQETFRMPRFNSDRYTNINVAARMEGYHGLNSPVCPTFSYGCNRHFVSPLSTCALRVVS